MLLEQLYNLMSFDSSERRKEDCLHYLCNELFPSLISSCPVSNAQIFPMPTVELIKEDDLTNIFFKWGTPQIVLCTHIDTVPPHIPPTIDGNTIYGRGACDAKGQIICMAEAVRRLLSEGYGNLGLLLLDAEETGSRGARLFNKCHKANAFPYVIVGEPTENRIIRAGKGIMAFKIHVTGKSAHSGYPELGESAVEKFVDFYNTLRNVQFPKDNLLGETCWNIGRLVSDNPSNILSPKLTAELYFRTTFATHNLIRHTVEGLQNQNVKVEYLRQDLPILFYVPKNLCGCNIFADTAATGTTACTTTANSIAAHTANNVANAGTANNVANAVTTANTANIQEGIVAFGSDAPALDCFANKMLMGCGTIKVAHTANEYITLQELEKNVENLVTVVKAVIKELKKNG